MPVADFAHNIQGSIFPMIGQPVPARPAVQPTSTTVADSSAASSDKDGKSFLDNLLDIVNPLEHIPIVSTIYDRLTGNKTGTLEQIAGDTLYGGVTGLAASVAGAAFKQAMGKSIGETVLALFDNDNSTKVADAATYLMRPADTQTEIATATPTAPPAGVPYSSYSAPAATAATAVAANPAASALTASLKRNNVDADLALRASYAYRQAVAQLDAP